jgi:hypothetical protein
MADPAQNVTVTDIRIPFVRMVFFMVKLALAAIPAAIILTLIGFALSALGVAIFGHGPGITL